MSPINPAPQLISNEIYRRSHLGALHPLSIPRVSAAVDLIRAMGWLDEANFHLCKQASVEQLAVFHDRAYISALQRAEKDGALPDEDCDLYQIGRKGNPIYKEVFSRPATSCGATLLAMDLLREGGVVHSPAGGTHHGRAAQASGFCYFNDIVLGILALLNQGLERIAYVDLDAHHGDGVQDAFHDDKRVLTVSIHQAGLWPHTGLMTDRAGGFARNLTVPEGLNDDEHLFLLEAAILPLVEQFDPEAIVVQCGCDALEDDPLSKLSLSNHAIWRAVDALRRMAPRVLFTGGGGYNPWSVARCWAGIWAVINDQSIEPEIPKEAQEVLYALSWRRLRKAPPAHWVTSIADLPRHGPIREEIRLIPACVLG